jgi:hypothetical protein
LKDLSGSVRLNNGSIGATVISATKGPETPVFIGTSQKKKIIQLFGYPSSTNPGIAEAIFYNQYRPLWISAPNVAGKHGGVYVTKTGTIPFTNGLSTKEIADFAAISVQDSIGTGDGTTTSFTFTLSQKAYYVNQSIDITVNGVSINVAATDVATEVLTTTPDVGDGTYVRSTGVLTFVFDTAPVLGAVIVADYVANIKSACYFAIVDKNFQVSDRQVKFSMDANKVFSMTATVLDSTTNSYLALPNSPYKFSLTEGYTSSSGEKIYIDNVLREDLYFDYILNTTLPVTTFTNDTVRVALNGGNRGTTPVIADYTRGWDFFKNKNTYKADIFFDTTALAGVAAIFTSLRDNNQIYSHYILPLPFADNLAAAIATKTGLSVSNRGISFYWNWGEITDNDTGSTFWTPLTGRVATKHALMDNYFNGLAPAWIDENNHGGLLGAGINKLKYDLQDDTEATSSETARINVIVNDPVYGIMIIAQRTSYLDETDYSYIGHSRLADYLLDNITKQVLPFQIVKLNDAEHRAIVKSKTESIVSAVAGKPYNLLADYLVVCDETNNDAEAMNRREFVLTVAIIFTKFSEKIRFIFVNAPSGSNLQEIIGG